MYASDYQNAHLDSSSAYKALMALAGLQRLLLAGWTGVRPDGLIADGPEEIRKAVRSEVKVGSEWIKLLVTGTPARTGVCMVNLDTTPFTAGSLLSSGY